MTTSNTSAPRSGSSLDLVWSFAPWFVFLIVGRIGSLYVAVGAAIVAVAIVTGRAITRRRLHMLDVVSALYFLGLGALLVAQRPQHLQHWADYAQAGSHTVLSLVVIGSVVVGHPFTAAYARETTPRQYWGSPEFKATNQRISSAWGLAFLIGTVSLFLAGATHQFPVILRVVVPFGSLLMAYRYTQSQITASTDDHTAGLAVRTPVR